MKINFVLGDKGGKKDKTMESEIAEQILKQPDRLATLGKILENLPSGLVDWFKGTVKWGSQTKNCMEIDVSNNLLSGMYLPGDIVIKKNRDPKSGDIVEIVQRVDETYSYLAVKVIKINLKEFSLYVESITDSESKGTISINNVICVIDNVILYGTKEWDKTVNFLNIECDKEEIKNWVKQQIDYIKNSENFHNKEGNIRKLNDRLKLVESK